MAFYQSAGTMAPTSLRAVLSCCYGGRQGRPGSPDDLPGSPPAEGEDDNDKEDKSDSAAGATEAAPVGNGPEPGGQSNGAAAVIGCSDQEVSGAAPEELLSGSTWAPPPQDSGPPPVGYLDAGIRYDCAERQVVARVIRVRDLRQPAPGDLAGRWNSVQVSLALLPARKQRHRTETVRADSLEFGESFVFASIYASELPRLAIRFRAYGCERRRRKLLLSEATLALAALQAGAAAEAPGNETTLQLPLKPCSGAKSHVGSDTGFSEASSTQIGSSVSVAGGSAELFLGLRYNAKTGQLAVEVIKGSGFRLPGSSRIPETVVKMALMASTSQILFKSKTSFAPATPNPMWKENFMFPVNRFQLTDVTIVTSVYAKRSINRREMIGWFAIGRNSSGDEEAAHWQEMLDAKAEQVSHWHRMLHPSERK